MLLYGIQNNDDFETNLETAKSVQIIFFIQFFFKLEKNFPF